MKTRKPVVVWWLTAALATITLGFALPDFKATTKEAMKRKLKHSQGALEGLALEKFDAVEKNAVALIRLSQTEAWHAIQTDEYRAFSAEFRRNAEALQNAAQKKNIDAAALSYVQMTLTCVNCHKYVRGKQKVAAL